MKDLAFHYEDTCGIDQQELEKLGQLLLPEIGRIQEALKTGYTSDYASINLPVDQLGVQKIQAVIQEKKALQPTALVVIGIGGSNLGTLAVHEALYGKFYNEQQPAIKVYFADTVDTDYINDILLLVEQEFEKGHNVIFNVVSKSGSTIETIANVEIFLTLLRAYKKEDYYNYVVATTDKDSKLWKFAEKERFTVLEIPHNVGGRYSVFSAVGLFPLGLIDVDLKQLLNGAQSMIPSCLSENMLANPAALSALMLKNQYYGGKNIHDTFLFSVDLEGFGRWYRQLMGESIGKEYDRSGGRVHRGITPTVSLGSTDLHSVGQLYLGGPADKVTTFISIEKSKSNLVVPRYDEFEKLVAHIQGKPLSSIMHAISRGVQAAYKKRGLPFVEFQLPEKSSWHLGQLMQCKMIEMMYLGFLLDINPFDQPEVELYKKETREILSHE